MSYTVYIASKTVFYTPHRVFYPLSVLLQVFAPREFFPQFGKLWVIVQGAACREGRIFVPPRGIAGIAFVLQRSVMIQGYLHSTYTACILVMEFFTCCTCSV